MRISRLAFLPLLALGACLQHDDGPASVVIQSDISTADTTLVNQPGQTVFPQTNSFDVQVQHSVDEGLTDGVQTEDIPINEVTFELLDGSECELAGGSTCAQESFHCSQTVRWTGLGTCTILARVTDEDGDTLAGCFAMGLFEDPDPATNQHEYIQATADAHARCEDKL